jgi:hypothetical protein
MRNFRNLMLKTTRELQNKMINTTRNSVNLAQMNFQIYQELKLMDLKHHFKVRMA